MPFNFRKPNKNTHSLSPSSNNFLSYFEVNKSNSINLIRLKFLYALETHRIVVLVASPGIGKSTKIPQILYNSGWNENGKIIGVVVSRKIAAIELAENVSREMNVNLGEEVGYAVKFDEYITRKTVNTYNTNRNFMKNNTNTKIKFVTANIILKEILNDPLLLEYSVIVIDDFHERRFFSDLLISLLKKILLKRSSLRVVFMSSSPYVDELFYLFTSTKDKYKSFVSRWDVQEKLDCEKYDGNNNNSYNLTNSCVSSTICHNQIDEKCNKNTNLRHSDLSAVLPASCFPSDSPPMSSSFSSFIDASSCFPDSFSTSRDTKRKITLKNNSCEIKTEKRSKQEEKKDQGKKNCDYNSHTDFHSKFSSSSVSSFTSFHKNRKKEKKKEKKKKKSNNKKSDYSETKKNKSSYYSDKIFISNKETRKKIKKDEIKESKFEKYFSKDTLHRASPSSSSSATLLMKQCNSQKNLDKKEIHIEEEKKLKIIETKEKIEDICVIHIEDKYFPVEINYLKQPTNNYIDAAVETVIEIHLNEYSGDILVFLPSRNDIEEAIKKIQNIYQDIQNKKNLLKLLPLPLYADLSRSKKMMAVKKLSREIRKVIFSTIICESSIAIEGINFVIDTCLVKTKVSYMNMDIISLGVISKEFAKIRSRKAGKEKAGKCYRLITEELYNSNLILERNIPEINRCDLTQIILYLKCLGIKKIMNFNFISPPQLKSLENAFEYLYALEAIDDSANLTNPLGNFSAQTFIPPNIARFLVKSTEKEYGCIEEACIISAVLCCNSFWSKNPKLKKSFDLLGFCVKEGDLISYFNAFQHFYFYQKNDSQWANRHFIDTAKMKKVEKIVEKIKIFLKNFNLPLKSVGSNLEKLMKAICCAFFYNAAHLKNDGSYELCRCIGLSECPPLFISPSSVFVDYLPPYVVFVEASGKPNQIYMHHVTPIDPRWLSEVAGHYFYIKEPKLPQE